MTKYHCHFCRNSLPTEDSLCLSCGGYYGVEEDKLEGCFADCSQTRTIPPSNPPEIPPQNDEIPKLGFWGWATLLAAAFAAGVVLGVMLAGAVTALSRA